MNFWNREKMENEEWKYLSLPERLYRERNSPKPNLSVTVDGRQEQGRWSLEEPFDVEVKTYPGGITEFQKRSGEHYFRLGEYNFDTLSAAWVYYMQSLPRPISSMTEEDYYTRGEKLEKGSEKCAGEIADRISAEENALREKLVEVLTRPGAWREVLLEPEGSEEKDDHLEAGAKDLTDRFLEVFGNSFNLLICHRLMPEIFEEAIKNLPPAGSEEQLREKGKENWKELQKVRAERIQEAEDFLKKVLREE